MADYIFCIGFGKKSNFIAVFPNYLKIGAVNFTGDKISFIFEKSFELSNEETLCLMSYGKQALKFLASQNEESYSYIISSNQERDVSFIGDYLDKKPIVSLLLKHQTR